MFSDALLGKGIDVAMLGDVRCPLDRLRVLDNAAEDESLALSMPSGPAFRKPGSCRVCSDVPEDCSMSELSWNSKDGIACIGGAGTKPDARIGTGMVQIVLKSTLLKKGWLLIASAPSGEPPNRSRGSRICPRKGLDSA